MKGLTLNLAMQSMAAKEAVILFLLNWVRLELFISGCHVTRRRFSFFACFCAFKNYRISSHFLCVWNRRTSSNAKML